MSRIDPLPVAPKHVTFRDPAYLRSAKDHRCDCCQATGTTVFCHDRREQTGGIGIKPDDWCGAFGCADCHRIQEAHPKTTDFWWRASLTMANEMGSYGPIGPDIPIKYQRVLMKGRYDQWKLARQIQSDMSTRNGAH